MQSQPRTFFQRRRGLLALLLLVALAALVWWRLSQFQPQQAFSRHGPGNGNGAMAQPVTASVAVAHDFPVWFDALGTVIPRTLVNVMPRVSGLLLGVDYKPGQLVKAGQLLARIDPAPFQVAVEQAQAKVEQDKALLLGSQDDLQRYETLIKQDSISAQQVADQRALVAQQLAQLHADSAALDNAKLQLQWTRITAPVSGLVGLRPVDPGNMIGTSGAIGTNVSSASTGSAGGAAPIASIAEIQPIDVVFALPQPRVGQVLQQLGQGAKLPAQAWDSADAKLLASGTVLAADNQINASTATLNVRAAFDNKERTLYPNQFVNVHLLLQTVPQALLVPSSAVAVGAPGTYVYVIGAGNKVALRPVRTGASDGAQTQIVSGLQPGEQVVTDGLDRLRDGAAVRVVSAAGGGGGGKRGAAGAAASGARPARAASAAHPGSGPHRAASRAH